MSSGNAVESLVATLERIEVGEPVSHAGLTLVPLLADNGHEPAYLFLEEALETGQAEVDEVNESGDVNTLKVTNRGKKPLLIPEGEIIAGMKQTRMVWITVLIAAESEHLLPVNCVEQGRWRRTGRKAKPEIYAHPTLRAKNHSSRSKRRRARQEEPLAAEASAEAADTGRREAAAEQGAVWEEVSEQLCAMSVSSATDSLEDAYASSRKRLAGYRKAVELPENACGVVLAYDGEVLGVDMFDSAKAMRKLWPRLSESYFVEGLRRGKVERTLKKAKASEFLQRIAEAAHESDEQAGEGRRADIEDDKLAGSALCHEGRVCHLSAYALEE